MIYNVLFSGGSDSTGMIYKLLKAGHTVRAHSIHIVNNKRQMEREDIAKRGLSELFTKEFKDTFWYYGDILSVEVKSYNQPYIDSVRYPQIPILLTALQYINTFPNRTHRTAIGITKSDDKLYREILSSKFNESLRFLPEAAREHKRSQIPKLVFLVSNISRENLFNSLPARYKKLITWCENDYSFPSTIPNCALSPNSKEMGICDKCAERSQMLKIQKKLLTRSYLEDIYQKWEEYNNLTYKKERRKILRNLKKAKELENERVCHE